ncbi:NADP-dependent D-sorbitol-6-phosphate dehydrogenase-like [Camellia sinensis]|uniref:NADP-dependent D-sorbitol-6-phosphate dehydrogenase-like n=1 Tax=Camellia sinensis TaxID=4442 RepID=UPI001036D2D9|nr:NADP-dependent D-sorbitol-6-phosphate dehydrogenase-like [Camellia sinensis]
MAVTLKNGYKMLIIGLGIRRMDNKDIKTVLIHAIKVSYRHFDCAAHYKNEEEVGEAPAIALQAGPLKREDLFITTELWNSDHGHVVEACKDSLKKLQLDCLDLYLVHFPLFTHMHAGVGKTKSVLREDGELDIDATISFETTWHAMEHYNKKGLW